MARLSCIFSIALVVVYLTVDCCCACHAHNCENENASLVMCDAAALEVKCPECLCDHAPHGPPGCRGCQCSLALPPRSADGSINLKFPTSFSGLTAADFPRPAISLHRQSRSTGSLLLPIRLHLANQVLLI